MTNAPRISGRLPGIAAAPVMCLAAASMLFSAAAPGSPLAAQQDMSDVRIETIELESDLFMLVGRGGNIGLSVAAVAAVSDQPVRWVLNTHWHGDHTGTAHTDGDAIVHFPRANVFHMGDTFLNGRYPFIDIDSGGGVDGVIAAANFVLERSDDATRIIPGHGGLAAPADLRAYRDMLETVRLRVAGMVADGRTADEVVEAAPTADLDEVWGANSERFATDLMMTHRLLTAIAIDARTTRRISRRADLPAATLFARATGRAARRALFPVATLFAIGAAAPPHPPPRPKPRHQRGGGPGAGLDHPAAGAHPPAP